jgi:hypothetical protein
MSYQVTKTRSNGYRCSCCRHDWEESEWYETLEEALAELPTSIYVGDGETTEIEIIDGSTGEKVAWGTALWSTGYERYSGYNFTNWRGYRPDTGAFSVVYDRNGKEIDRTWEDVTAELREDQRRKELSQAQRDLEDAQKRIANLGGSRPPEGG